MDNKDLKELASPDYWNNRYKQQEEQNASAGDSNEIGCAEAYEWFRSFDQLQPFFEKQLKDFPKTGLILHLGCGESTLPANLYALGYHHQLCVDFSHVVIEQMVERYCKLTIQWRVMDVRDIHLPEQHIDLAIDKGTLDAFLHGSLWSPPDDVRENVARYVNEVVRVLRPGGRWLYITYRQPHFMKPLLDRPAWDLQVRNLNDDAGGFEYFAFVMTKHLEP